MSSQAKTLNVADYGGIPDVVEAVDIGSGDHTVSGYFAIGLYVGGAGNVSVDTPNSTNVILTGVPAGTFIPLRITVVNQTSTTATNMTLLGVQL